MINLLLIIIARILFKIVSPFSFIYVLFIKERFTWSRVYGYWRSSAVSWDRYGNHQYRSFWNALLIKDNGYEFGDFRETISSALGKNEQLSFIQLKDRFYYLPSSVKVGKWYRYKISFKKHFWFKYRVFVHTPYTRFGIVLNRILNLIDRNHCINSINNNLG